MSDGNPWMTVTIGGTIKEPGQEHLPKLVPSLPLCWFSLRLPPIPNPLSLCEALLPPQTESSESFPIRQSHSPVFPSFAYLSARPLFTRSGGQVVLGTGGGRWWWVGLFKETLWRKWVWQEKKKKKLATMSRQVLWMHAYFTYAGTLCTQGRPS